MAVVSSANTQAQQAQEVFDLEMDLIETIELTSDIRVDRKHDGPLVTALAKWARSRGAKAPLERG